jgi:hypothetical protein
MTKCGWKYCNRDVDKQVYCSQDCANNDLTEDQEVELNGKED